MPNRIDPHEVYRDLINWMDVTEPGWRAMDADTKADLLGRACAYFAGVSRRYRIPDGDFMPPLKLAASWVPRESVS